MIELLIPMTIRTNRTTRATTMITATMAAAYRAPSSSSRNRFISRAATVVADRAAGANHPVTGNHDRDRVRAQRRPSSPGGAGVAGPVRGLAVGDHLAERHPGGGSQHPPVEPRVAEPPVERELEAVPPSLEVFVQLAAGLVESGGELEHPGRDALGQLGQHVFDPLVGKRDPHQALGRRRHQAGAERRVHGGVGDVYEALLVGPGRQPVDELAHLAISFSSAALARSFLSASWTLCRAASSDVPRASPTSR